MLERRHTEVRSFGRSIAGSGFPDSDALLYQLAPLDSGRFAAVQQRYRFLIQIWDTSGVLRQEFRRDPTWFPRSSRGDRQARDSRAPPFPVILGAFANLERRELWIAAIVPDRRWSDVAPRGGAARLGREGTGATAIDSFNYPRAYDTVIGVLHLDSGRVRVSQRFDAYVPYFMEGRLLYGLREESTGLYVLVWRPDVRP